MYRAHSIEFLKEDREKAYNILANHFRLGNINDLRVYEDVVRGQKTLTFQLHLYVSEDFERIKNDFKLAGIQIL